jgi:hypothetical protein
MKNLVLPNKVEIQLVEKSLFPVRLEAVLFEIRLFARYKNDFILGPFASDDSGLVKIVKKDMESEIASNYDSDLMGHSRVEDCLPTVDIRLLSEDDIRRAAEARSKTWRALLAGERDRWDSIEQLLKMYQDANNKHLVVEQASPNRHDWNKPGAEYSYNFVVTKRVAP